MGELLKNFSFNSDKSLISIVAPAYNEMQIIETFHAKLSDVLNQHNYHYEIIYVDDGSHDQTFGVLQSLRKSDSRISVLRFSRNFGKEIAVTAGLEKARGDAVIVIDSDLQDPPELIPEMIKFWQLGADLVNMRRADRSADSWFKRMTAKYFYKAMKKLSHINIDEDVGDFRLLSRRVVNAINQMPERVRFMKGIFAWVGFQKVTINYTRQARGGGETKWPYWRLWNFALDGITSFSTAPLKIFLYTGFLFTIAALVSGVFVAFNTLTFGVMPASFSLIMLGMFFLGGIQLISLGFIGEYIGRIFVEVKARPLYLVDQYLPSEISRHASDAEFSNPATRSRNLYYHL